MAKEKSTGLGTEEKKSELATLIQYLEVMCETEEFEGTYVQADLEKNLILGRLDADQYSYYLYECADILQHVALKYYNDKSAEKALEVYYKAIAIYQTVGRTLSDESVTHWGQILYSIGQLYLENEEPEKTLLAYQLAKSLHQTNGKAIDDDYSGFWSSTFHSMGDLYVSDKLYGKALEVYSLGLKAVLKVDRGHSTWRINVPVLLMQLEHLGEHLNKLDKQHKETDALGDGTLTENFRLREIAKKLSDDTQRQELIKQALSSATEEPDEFDSIISTVIRAAYNAGLNQSGANVGPAKAQANINTDNHAKLLAPFVEEIKQSGITTLQGIADALNEKGIYTKNDKPWYPSTIKPLLERIASISQEDGVSLDIDDHTQRLIPILKEIKQDGVNTMQGIAESLNERGFKTRAGGSWHAKTVKPLVHRIEGIEKLHDLQTSTSRAK